ncbi:glycosyltransferase family 9 protein [Bdellovibrio bacteriovorus]|uniref:glycosyltransferase family 9 protein n=1 Tax=Bdellovibrio bacteriovorus TaxID=959 RepID=UPI0021CF2D46|nr:glycosyltransferase family 9 protein [Bdellovibrio bacteriovorus]UXR64790.1 glycosyltransferase family 9 protein [Bdellovibrio bacteriovorus]
MKRVLLIRLDKIGDLICTMCVDQVSFLKDWDQQWVIAKGLGFVPDHADPHRKYIELAKEDSKESLQKLRAFLKEYKPDLAVSFQAPWWVSYALWAEGVPVRAGVRSQWHSFLFLNKGLRQRRSLAVKHEAEYNLDVLKHALNNTSSDPAPVLKLQAPTNPELLAKHHLSAGGYVVVHPGMAGSALNWPIANYVEFIKQVRTHTQVVLTGTAADEKWLTDIKATFKGDTNVLCLQGLLKASELFTVLKNAKAVVVPSTGVAHMAASLGATVLGIYPHVRVQKPVRWAARGPHVHIFEAPTLNPDGSHCDGTHCEEFHCMEKITVEQLLHTLSSL